MTCYFPLHAYKDKSKDAQKMKLVFKRPGSWKGEAIDLPCGQCIGCRLEYSRQWAVRCMHESSLYDENCFVTLTYNDQNIPPNNSLVLSDFQNFMKRLRKSIEPKKIRFYHCGEYGDLFERPHYHAILFNHDFSDKKFFKRSGENNLYTSDTLEGLWNKGFATVGSVSFDSAAYVARYVMKKVTGKDAEKHYGLRIPEYTTMSRRPGIGKGWYDKFKSDVYPLDRLVVNGVDTRPPRFYDNLFAKDSRSDMELIKIKRERENKRFVSEMMNDGTIIRYSDNDGGRLRVREEVKRAEISILKR